MKESWDSTEAPILRAIEDADSRGERSDSAAVARATGLERDRVDRSIEWLVEDGYVTGHDVTSMADRRRQFMGLRLLPRGLRSVGRWPSEDSYAQMLTLIENRVAAAADPDERSRLQKLRDGLIAAGQAVATTVLTEWAKRQAGL